MEQFQYCSPNGGRFTVIHLLSAAWSVFHVPLLPAFLLRCMLDASGERKVSRALHLVLDDARYEASKTREALSRDSQEFVPDFRIRPRRKSKILFLTLGGISSGRIERVTEAVFL
jgi:hypothetical protein